MLQDVDQSIINLLLAELRLNTDGLVQDESQIQMGLPPDGEPTKDQGATVYLFLHDVHENLALRDQSFEVRRGPDQWEVGKSRRPSRLNVSYLLTVRGPTPAVEHRLLGEALGVLMRNGIVPDQYLEGSLAPYGEQALALSVAQKDHWAHGDGSKIWQAAGQPMRPFIGIVASAMFDPFETKTVKLVREAILAVGQGVPMEGPNRQVDVRSIMVSAAGRVLDATGNELEDVIVGIKDESEETRSDAHGVFFFVNLAPGRYTLTFRKRGFESSEATVEAPPRGLSNQIQPVAIQLIASSDSVAAKNARGAGPTSLSLVGTLRYADGRVAPFVPVRVGGRTVVTDEQGMYYFTDLPGGPRELVAEVSGMGELTVSVKPNSAGTELPKK